MTHAIFTGSEGWTDERVELLKTLWQDGHSASQIAKRLGGVTRNSVLSKIHRIGASARAKAAPPRRLPKQYPDGETARVIRKVIASRRPRPAATRVVAPPPTRKCAPEPPKIIEAGVVLPFVAVVEGPGLATIMTLGAGMCAWPIGDPLEPDFTLCGREADARYCTAHAHVAFRPAKATPKDLMRSLRRHL